MKYFSNFPLISYNNVEVRDITRRVVLDDRNRDMPFVFYPYDITFHLRSDQVAEYLYNDSYLDWMIYLSNKIIDPMYGWYVRDDQLDSLITSKYGSTPLAKRKVKYFMNNWYEHAEDKITVSFYDNNIDKALKKYYDPIFAENNRILAYARRRVDQKVNTNRVIDFTISEYVAGNTYTDGELVEIWQTANQVGAGEVVFSNSSLVRLQSTFGNTSANSSSNTFIIGETSAANATISNSNVMMENLTAEEEVYWSPVYFYDHEVMKNEERRTINLVGREVIPFLVSDFVNKVSANTI